MVTECVQQKVPTDFCNPGTHGSAEPQKPPKQRQMIPASVNCRLWGEWGTLYSKAGNTLVGTQVEHLCSVVF